MTRPRAGCRAAVAILAMVLVAGCGDDPTEPEGVNFRVMLTDAPSDELLAVNVYFEDLKVKPAGGPVEHDLPLTLPSNPQDLLVLTDDTVILAAGSLEPGTYEFITIGLDQERSNVVELDGTVRELRIPSEKIKIIGPFEVPDLDFLELTLDFDADASLVHLGNGDWLMTPQVVIASVDDGS